MKRTLIAVLAWLAVAADAGAQTMTPPPGIPASVAQTSNVRAAPDIRAEIVGRLAAGDEVTVNGRSRDERWYRIFRSDSMQGWLPVFALTLAGDPGDLPLVESGSPVDPAGTPAPVFVSAVGRVNIRQQPYIADNVIGQLEPQQQARATARSSQENDWLLIETETVSGWVAYFTVRVTGDPRVLPVLVPVDGALLIPPSLQVTTLFNARLRTEPGLDAPVLMIVAFGERVTLLGRNDAADWLYVRYNELEGWIDANLVDAAPEQAAALPLMLAEVTPET
jgi:uncharacterized protein YgiM (DUF1202 family)